MWTARPSVPESACPARDGLVAVHARETCPGNRRAESREPRAESREPALYTGADSCPG